MRIANKMIALRGERSCLEWSGALFIHTVILSTAPYFVFKDSSPSVTVLLNHTLFSVNSGKSIVQCHQTLVQILVSNPPFTDLT